MFSDYFKMLKKLPSGIFMQHWGKHLAFDLKNLNNVTRVKYTKNRSVSSGINDK